MMFSKSHTCFPIEIISLKVCKNLRNEEGHLCPGCVSLLGDADNFQSIFQSENASDP